MSETRISGRGVGGCPTFSPFGFRKSPAATLANPAWGNGCLLFQATLGDLIAKIIAATGTCLLTKTMMETGLSNFYIRQSTVKHALRPLPWVYLLRYSLVTQPRNLNSVNMCVCVC